MGNRLRKLRKLKGLTLQEETKLLAKMVDLNLSPDTISKYERGDREPKLATWTKFANFFDVSLGYLQGYSDSRQPDYTSDIRTAPNKRLVDFAFYDLIKERLPETSDESLDIASDTLMRIFDIEQLLLDPALPFEGKKEALQVSLSLLTLTQNIVATILDTESLTNLEQTKVLKSIGKILSDTSENICEIKTTND
ncbi:helix-turn-helix transcriptional regulator [Liquorilactobacillus mali]|uniref:helix-turn-helix domain-containing protein n=1 Tax=Liquorilactobacillus mali TaxID=1618 RepID=UPI00264D580D|nr:helix-turn-helix transcriptional regulator [Liquorilactobacillus mali]MDN7145356.1 helix-turn-helix transcriptional regulator [Liquorilactobacillus mali]